MYHVNVGIWVWQSVAMQAHHAGGGRRRQRRWTGSAEWGSAWGMTSHEFFRVGGRGRGGTDTPAAGPHDLMSKLTMCEASNLCGCIPMNEQATVTGIFHNQSYATS
jgi:hypothetical protein